MAVDGDGQRRGARVAVTVDDRIVPGERITIGFDGARTGDATALVACRVSDGLLQPLGVWEDSGEPGWEVPWAEPPVTGTGPPERASLEVAFLTAMRRTGALMQLMTQAAAERIGINATDLQCLNILSFNGHMTAGELARATGLTTASITGVVDRLEEAGYVTRERDPHDRRRPVITGPGTTLFT